jgi:hypothetical protein
LSGLKHQTVAVVCKQFRPHRSEQTLDLSGWIADGPASYPGRFAIHKDLVTFQNTLFEKILVIKLKSAVSPHVMQTLDAL